MADDFEFPKVTLLGPTLPDWLTRPQPRYEPLIHYPPVALRVEHRQEQGEGGVWQWRVVVSPLDEGAATWMRAEEALLSKVLAYMAERHRGKAVTRFLVEQLAYDLQGHLRTMFPELDIEVGHYFRG